MVKLSHSLIVLFIAMCLASWVGAMGAKAAKEQYQQRQAQTIKVYVGTGCPDGIRISDNIGDEAFDHCKEIERHYIRI